MLIHVTAGRGPAECQLAVAKFLAALSQETAVEILATEEGRFVGCLKSALIRTEIADPSLQGTALWICKSPFRPNCRRKNWFFGVNQIEEPAECAYQAANGGGILFQTFRAGGKGGQHVNKTESAVRAIHNATGLTATAEDERSQFQNKKIARERLSVLLKNAEDAAMADEKEALFCNHNTLTRGGPMRTYEGISFRPTNRGDVK